MPSPPALFGLPKVQLSFERARESDGENEIAATINFRALARSLSNKPDRQTEYSNVSRTVAKCYVTVFPTYGDLHANCHMYAYSVAKYVPIFN